MKSARSEWQGSSNRELPVEGPAIAHPLIEDGVHHNDSAAQTQLRPKGESEMIRKLRSGQYRLYSRKVDRRTGRRRKLGTFGSRSAAEKHERAIQFFKRRR